MEEEESERIQEVEESKVGMTEWAETVDRDTTVTLLGVNKVTKVWVEVYMKRKFELKTLMVEHPLSIYRHCTDILCYFILTIISYVRYRMWDGLVEEEENRNGRQASWERIQGW